MSVFFGSGADGSFRGGRWQGFWGGWKPVVSLRSTTGWNLDPGGIGEAA